ncbi:ABC transporter ATP-binding protein [Haloglycomyces albus]|uniref:ABC transporter ATP-binding protein n=1 Tax=Haloglycomyces albus TaxID=526067 RepID=UPI00046D56D6|nr:ABC transporter ATP-binding protein [Haloglycomyces albus]
MESAIEVNDLTKTFRPRNRPPVEAVKQVNFSVGEGEFFGILGPNGAGKTTTLEMVEGVQRPDDGSVRVLGTSPWPHNPDLTRRMGVQLQTNTFFEFLNVTEQLTTFAELYGQSADRVEGVLETVGLSEHRSQRCEKLSGGQQQRLSIACALVADPEVLFLDEPTASLDPQARRNMWELLRTINSEGRTVVLTTHYMEEAEYLCDRVAIMDGGRILALDSPETLIQELDAPTAVKISTGQLEAVNLDDLTAIDSVSENGATVFRTRRPKELLVQLAEADALEGLTVRTSNLEDVFLNVTGREWRD